MSRKTVSRSILGDTQRPLSSTIYQKQDSKTERKADALKSTEVDKHGQEQRIPSATSSYTPSLRGKKEHIAGFNSPLCFNWILKNVATHIATPTIDSKNEQPLANKTTAW